MSESTPIIVNESAVPGALTSAVRQIALVGGGWAVGRGYLDSDTLSALVTIGVIVGPFIYGQIKGWRNHQRLVKAAGAAPNNVAVVTEK